MLLRIWAWAFDTIPSAKSTFILTGVALAWLFVIMVGMSIVRGDVSIPPCQEDEVIVGVGNFYSDGYWDEYLCVHPEVIING